MRSLFVILTALVVTACAPVLHVVRETTPQLVVPPEQQPLAVVPQTTGSALIDLFHLFTDAHSLDLDVARRVGAALQRVGRVKVQLDCAGDCTAPAQLLVRTANLQVSAADSTATATVMITLPDGVTVETVGKAFLQGADDATVLSAALEDAASQFASKFVEHEVTDTFTLEDGPELREGNARLRDGDAAGARAAYQAVIDAHPGHVGAHLNLSVALTALGELDAASRAAERAAEVDVTARKANRVNAAREAATRAKTTRRVLSFSVVSNQ